MLDKYCEDFIAKSNENYELFEFLKDSDKFIDWQIVAIFYSALCFAKAYLYKKGMPINSINSHDNIKFFLCNERNAKDLQVIKYYDCLYVASRDARYKHKKMTKEKLQRALKDYNKVMELLRSIY